jgi:nucleoside-diphosphate kinase
VEKTLVLLKPDSVQRRLIGQIIQRFENKGLKISAMKLMQITEELASKHYAEHKERPFYKDLVEFMTSRPVVAMAISGPRAVSVVRKLMGATFGFNAEPGTIRGDFGVSNQFNLVHGSDSVESAEREVALFFNAEELLEYPLADDDWNACG